MTRISPITRREVQIEEIFRKRYRQNCAHRKSSRPNFFYTTILGVILLFFLLTISFPIPIYLSMLQRGGNNERFASSIFHTRSTVQMFVRIWPCSLQKGRSHEIFVGATNTYYKSQTFGPQITKKLNKVHQQHQHFNFSKSLISRGPIADGHRKVSRFHQSFLYSSHDKVRFFTSVISLRKNQAPIKTMKDSNGNTNIRQNGNEEPECTKEVQNTSSSSNISKKKKLKKLKKPEKSRKNVGKMKGVDWFNNRNFYSYENFSQITFSDEKKYPVLARLEENYEPFTVLGIESSCDDTGVAVVRSDGEILGQCIASQNAIHEEWGGVVPGLARDAHAAAINETVTSALKAAGMTSVHEVDAIAVTQGPGLEICLRVGVEKAKELATSYNKPFVCVHHLEAHCLVARLANSSCQISTDMKIGSLDYPFLALLVSGGHCLILEVRGLADFVILGGTLDDALGEAYDKAARLIGITKGVAGGAILESFARQGNPKTISLPVPLKGKKNLDLSYSGLKNALRMAVDKEIEKVKRQRQHSIRWKIKEFISNLFRKIQGGDTERSETEESFKGVSKNTPRLSKSKKNLNNASDYLSTRTKEDIAASFQNIALKHLEDRLSTAMDICSKKSIHRLAVVGGVAANQELRSRLIKLCKLKTDELKKSSMSPEDFSPSWELYIPPAKLCTDNGVMVAWAGIEKLKSGYVDTVEEVDVRARWSLGQVYIAK